MSKADRIIELVKGGLSQAEAARRVGVSSAYAFQCCSRVGIKGLTEAGRQAMAAAGRNTPAEARARQAETNRRLGAEYRRSMGFPEPQTGLATHRDGKSYSEVARQFGLTRNQVAGFVFRAKRGTSHA